MTTTGAVLMRVKKAPPLNIQRRSFAGRMHAGHMRGAHMCAGNRFLMRVVWQFQSSRWKDGAMRRSETVISSLY